MTTTILVIGDTHFRPKHMREGVELSEKIVEKAAKVKPNFIVLLGDTLDNHEKADNAPFNVAHDMIDRLSEICKVFLIIGNHDVVDQREFLSRKHFFNPFKKWPNVTVVDKVTSTKFNTHTFIFCPYTPKGRFIEALNTLEGTDWKTSTCIFAHQEMRGCRNEEGMVSTDGDEWNPDLPPVISGHIHESQKVGTNIYYVGSSLQVKSNESPEKRIWKVVFSGKKDKRIIKINLHIRFIKKVEMNIEDARKFDTSLVENYNIILSLIGFREEFKEFKNGDLYESFKKLGIVMHFVPKKVDLDIKVTDTTSFQEIFYSLVQKEDDDTKKAYRHLTKIQNE